MTAPGAAQDRLRRLARAARALPSTTPLRVKLVVALLALVALALVAAGTVGTTALRGHLTDRVDKQLQATAHDGLRSRPLSCPDRGSGGGPWYRPAPQYGYFLQVTNANGSQATDANGNPAYCLTAPNGSGQTAPTLPTLTLATAIRLAGPPFTTDPVGTGHRWRVLVTPLLDGSGALTIAISLDEVDNIVGRLTAVNVVIGLAVLVAFGLLGYGVVRSSLRSLVAVETTAKAIAAGDLARRVPELSERTEVGRLAAALNSMLAQVEAAFAAQQRSEAEARGAAERMRRFLADASHELRTPLSSVRGFAELHRQGGVPEDSVPRMMRRIEDEATRMGVLVEDMLLLARLDQQRPLERRPVDLLAIVADAVHDAPAMSANHPVRLDLTGSTGSNGAPPVVLGDEARLRQVVTNLVTNAVQHTPPGTAVRVGLRTAGDLVELSVADDGPGLAAQDAARVFERFYRADQGRTRQQGGAGLGLTIVSALVAAHGGAVGLRTVPGQGATFVVRLPLQRAAAEGPATEGPATDRTATDRTATGRATPDLAAPSEFPAGTQS